MFAALAGALGLGSVNELRLVFWCICALATAGLALYIHHSGYEECRAPQVAAQKAQKAADTKIDQGVVSENQQAQAALTAPGGVASTPPPVIPVCRPGRLPARPSAAAAGPSQPPAAGSDSGVLAGIEAEAPVDVGPVMQDLALTGVLGVTRSERLWERDVKQAQEKPK